MHSNKKWICFILKLAVSILLVFSVTFSFSLVIATEGNLSNLQYTLTTDAYTAEKLCFWNGSKRIYGYVYIPNDAEGECPAVIYAHGYGANFVAGYDYADTLARNGYVVYCFDFCGGSTYSKSSGSNLSMSVLTEEEDLQAVIYKLRDESFVDENQIFLIGASQGGLVSAITAADNCDAVKGLILLYPAFMIVDNINDMFSSTDDIPSVFEYLWMYVGQIYARDLLGYDVYSEISSFKKDVLILHGDCDDLVPMSYSEKAVDTYKSAQLKIISGGGHGFTDDALETANAYVLKYLKNHTD